MTFRFNNNNNNNNISMLVASQAVSPTACSMSLFQVNVRHCRLPCSKFSTTTWCPLPDACSSISCPR